MNRSAPRYLSFIPSGLVILILFIVYIANLGVFEVLRSTPPPLEQPIYLHSLILRFEESNRVWSIILAIITLGAGMLLTMRAIMKSNLFGEATQVPAIIYLAVVAAFATSNDILTPAIAALVMSLAINELYEGYTDLSSSAKIFGGCFYIGVLPLLYPSLSTMFLLFFAVVTLFERSGRDILTAISAMVTPSLMVVYVRWLFGTSLSDIILELRGVIGSNITSIWSQWGGLLFMLIIIGTSAYSLRCVDDLSTSQVSRKRITFSVLAIAMAVITPVQPSFAVSQWMAFAAPAAVAITTTLVVLRERPSTIVYVSVVVASLLSLVLP